MNNLSGLVAVQAEIRLGHRLKKSQKHYLLRQLTQLYTFSSNIFNLVGTFRVTKPSVNELPLSCYERSSCRWH
jgi:hypothetical protein